MDKILESALRKEKTRQLAKEKFELIKQRMGVIR